MTSSPPAGLRARKKAKTRAAIRAHAMRLFAEQGYAATTVDQIAEAAEVSPSTFFRYFPTKEDVVLTDDYDPAMIAAVRAQPAGVPPVEAVRRGIREVFDRMTPQEWAREQARQHMVRTVPELRARTMQQYTEMIGVLAAVVAERAGRPADDFGARVVAGAVLGAVLAAIPEGMASPVIGDDLGRVDEALTLLRRGLPL